MSFFITALPLKILYFGFCFYWFTRIQKGPMLPLVILLCIVTVMGCFQTVTKPQGMVWQVKLIRSNYVEAQNGNQRVLLYHVSGVKPDDIIQIKGKWEAIHSNQNFYGFSFMNWAQNKKLYYSMYVQQHTVIKAAHSLRARVYQRAQALPSMLREMVMEALYGMRSEDSSLSYLVSSSGMHISWITRGIEKLLLLCLSPFWAFVLSILVMMGIGNITVFSIALLRIIIFRILYYLTRGETAHDRLGICMLGWLLFMPRGYQELCFVLPVLFQLVKLFQQRPMMRLMTSWLVIIPIQLLYFYECDIIQVITFPIQRVLYSIHYLTALGSLILQADLGISIMQKILLVFMKMPSLFLIGYPSVIWLLFWLKHGLRVMKQDIKKPIMGMMGLLVINQYSNVWNPFGEVMFIDVGQGDTALITLPFNQGTIMIDMAGHKTRNIPSDIVYPILRAKGIEHIDTLLITHDDFDHSGGVAQLQELLPIHTIIRKKTTTIKTGNLEIQGLLANETFDDKNANSQIFFFQLGGLRYLMMGDGDKDTERRLIQRYPKLRAEVLKIGHHGSNTSSDVMFLHQVHPILGVISSGYRNRYGHPSPETIEHLKTQGISYRNTADHGAISIIFFKNFHVFRTATHEFDIIPIR